MLNACFKALHRRGCAAHCGQRFSLEQCFHGRPIQYYQAKDTQSRSERKIEQMQNRNHETESIALMLAQTVSSHPAEDSYNDEYHGDHDPDDRENSAEGSGTDCAVLRGLSVCREHSAHDIHSAEEQAAQNPQTRKNIVKNA